ncbi:MAG TPA: ATP-binding cassette domain-containing protein, partial [Burkholderiaceae bacterium]|nr:ATP-binding cassette domain-containing protein [Burkholderiaceae bacterium]
TLRVGAFSGRPEPPAAIRASLDEVYRMLPRLAERRDQPAQTLSGGERQMLALGRAFMARPRLLLLDEPSLGLAPLIVRDIIDVVRRLCDRGIAVLLVEQNANLALSIADRGHVMENGRIVATGSAQALRSDPAVRATYLGVQVESSGSPAPRHNVSA